MPDERTDAEIGGDGVPSSDDLSHDEAASTGESQPEPPSIIDPFPPPDVSQDARDDGDPTVIGGPAYSPAERPIPMPLPPPGDPTVQPRWAGQRTIGADDSWDAGTPGYAGVPVFDSAPYEPIPVAEGVDRPLTDEERAEAAAAEAERRRQRTKTVVREIVETVLLALLVFLAVRASFQNFKVEGNSMFPTLDDGEFLIVNKLVYSEVDIEKLGRFIPFLEPGENPKRWVFHGPERGDIIVLQDPRDPGVDLIKRVIGLPGDRFEIIQGRIFINGFLLEEPYIKSPWRGSLPETTIPPGEYFVMGDNRDNSQDSRSLGLVPKDLIIGKALLAYWPLDDFGVAPNKSPSISDRTVADIFGDRVPRAAASGR